MLFILLCRKEVLVGRYEGRETSLEFIEMIQWNNKGSINAHGCQRDKKYWNYEYILKTELIGFTGELCMIWNIE